MKKFINDKKYDTDTAKLIHEWDNGHYTNDFNYCSEDLYRTKKGAYFLDGNGGAMSGYAESCGNSTGSGSDITPLTEKEAMEWLEEHDGADAIEEYFADKIEEA